MIDDVFVEEYRHFASFGFTVDQIADRLGMSREYVLRRARKLGVYRPGPYERQAAVVLDRLIESGEPFTAEALPCLWGDESLPRALLKMAESRVVRVGTRKSAMDRHGKRVGLYVGVAA